MKNAMHFAAVILLLSTNSWATNRCADLFKGQSDVLQIKSNNTNWKDTEKWDQSTRHSNDFFIRTGWDEKSGSFASEISNDGKVLSDFRHLISTSRMIYGLAIGSKVEPSYLQYARRQADFLLNKMTASDEKGLYFKSAVDSDGIAKAAQTNLVVNEQAYGLNGLVALYSVTRDPVLLAKIEALYKSFYDRFHDSANLGFFDTYDLASGKPSQTKSYNSTVYVATSFLVELAKLPTPNRQTYIRTVQELADQVANHFFDPKTGWIIENFTTDWRADWRDWQKQTVDTPQGKREYTIGVTGHNFQAAWFLLRAAEYSDIPESSRQSYLDTAREILSSMLASHAIDRVNGGVFDVFKREDGENMWHTNKAWWQQAEAILALTKADLSNLFSDPAQRIDVRRVRNQILDFYFSHFIDIQNGGEFPVVQKDGTPILTENKGQLGTGSYHQVELARIMKQYASQTKAEVAGWNRKTVEKFFSNYGLIGNWTEFMAEQTKTLSPSMTTLASDHRGTKTYSGPNGYFESLGDWSQVFSTGADFRVEIVESSATRVVVRLHGTLTLKTPIQGLNAIPDSKHQWTEIFSIAPDGSIEKLQVLMNIFK